MEPLRQRKKLRLEHYDYSAKANPYFLTICCHQRQPFFEKAAIAGFVRDEIIRRNDLDGATIYCFTIMPDHLHALISLRTDFRGTLQSWVSSFKSFTAKAGKREFEIWKLWQANFYEHIVRQDESIVEIMDYILNNPVRKGLADKWDEYPYSRMLVETIL